MASSLEAEWEQDLRSLFDPTVLSRSVFFETKYIDRDRGAWAQGFNLGANYAWSIGKDADVGIRGVLPTTYLEPGKTSGGDPDFGLADIKLTPSFAYRARPGLGQGLGLEAVFDTATEDSLGSGSILLKPIYGIGYRLTDFLTLTGIVGFQASVWEEAGVGRTRVLDFSPGIDLSYPKAWRSFVGVAYKGTRDFEAELYTNRMSVTVGKEFGKEHVFSLLTSCEFPLDDETDEIEVLLGISYFLP